MRYFCYFLNLVKHVVYCTVCTCCAQAVVVVLFPPSTNTSTTRTLYLCYICMHSQHFQQITVQKYGSTGYGCQSCLWSAEHGKLYFPCPRLASARSFSYTQAVSGVLPLGTVTVTVTVTRSNPMKSFCPCSSLCFHLNVFTIFPPDRRNALKVQMRS